MSDRPKRGRRRPGRPDEGDSALPGACLVTMCTLCREGLFGHVVNGVMRLNQTGEIARRSWDEIPRRFPSVALDTFVVMPNHLHGIVEVGGGDSLAAIVRWYRSSSTRRINEARSEPGTHIWRRGYQEHAVRNQRELLAVREYIQDNPALWEEDENHPAFSRKRADRG